MTHDNGANVNPRYVNLDDVVEAVRSAPSRAFSIGQWGVLRADVLAAIEALPMLPQRQDSVTEQLEDLALVATRLGMYDAADFIKAKLHGGPYDHAR